MNARPGAVMGRVPRRIAVLLAASLAACSSSTSPSVAGIAGAHDLALVDDLLFATSTDDNELHVVDLSPDTPNWVRAPNPLLDLSIPVVDRPVALARDVRWENDKEIGGPYVYALSANSRDISIISTVGADSLTEKRKWTLPLGPGFSFTAAAAQGASDGPSTLFLATYDGSTSAAQIRRVQLPGPDGLRMDTSLTLETPLVELPCAVVTSLLILPGDRIAWSSRPSVNAPSVPASCASPTTPLAGFITLTDPTHATTALQFPSPVRTLFTHEGFTEPPPNETTPATAHPAAERIFGVLDESACAGAPECRGIFAVDIGPNGSPSKPAPGVADCGGSPGKVACDFTGTPMLRIRSGGELIMGAALLVDAGPALVTSSGESLTSPLIGVYTTSDGRMVFFDAWRLRHFDLNADGPTPVDFGLRAPDGSPLQAEAGPVAGTMTLADGMARDETINFTYLGDLPGFSKLTAPQSPSPEISATADPTGVVQLAGDGGTADVAYLDGSGCSGLGTVSNVTGFAARDGGFTIDVDTAIGGANCTVSIRPNKAGPQPWVVAGTSSGYLGRITPSASADPTVIQELPADSARRSALFFNRPLDFNATNPPPPLLKLAFVDPPSLPSLADRAPGYRVELTTAGHFQIAEVPLGQGVTVAGTVVHPPVRTDPAPEHKELWITAFRLSGNAIIRYQLGSVRGGIEASGLVLQ